MGLASGRRPQSPLEDRLISRLDGPEPGVAAEARPSVCVCVCVIRILEKGLKYSASHTRSSLSSSFLPRAQVRGPDPETRGAVSAGGCRSPGRRPFSGGLCVARTARAAPLSATLQEIGFGLQVPGKGPGWGHRSKPQCSRSVGAFLPGLLSSASLGALEGDLRLGLRVRPAA